MIHAVKHVFSLYSVTYRHIIERAFAGKALRYEDVNKECIYDNLRDYSR